MAKKYIPKQIAPKLASGVSREKVYNAWPPEVKKGMKLVAAAKHVSLNWLIEQAVLEKFGVALRREKTEMPEYVETKKRSRLSLVRRRA